MATLGADALNEAYGTVERPWPLGPDDWESAARLALERGPYDYIAGGAGSESTVRANQEAFHDWRLRPRMLRGNAERELAVSLPGLDSPLPLLLAPVGVQSIAHPEGELATARAARQAGVPMVVSSAATHSMEEIRHELGDSPAWYQLYWVSDREVVESLVRRAKVAGYRAIVVTLDTLSLGWRDRDLRNSYLPFLAGEGIGQFTSDPVFRSRLSTPPEEDPAGAGLTFATTFPNLGLTWSDIAWLRERTDLPLIAKGILTAEDAGLAVDHGFSGVIVSNHGGRQVDGAVAALDALPEVVDAVGERATVLMDSGIRRGADVVKALCLGARAVLLGRPYMWGLAVGGADGVAQVLRALSAEVDQTLALLGARSARELDRSWITRRP
ncbi:MAG: alpha-hydroxy-acid oxidizing protein [Candidatus Dormibacteria bacterium]